MYDSNFISKLVLLSPKSKKLIEDFLDAILIKDKIQQLNISSSSLFTNTILNVFIVFENNELVKIFTSRELAFKFFESSVKKNKKKKIISTDKSKFENCIEFIEFEDTSNVYVLLFPLSKEQNQS